MAELRIKVVNGVRTIRVVEPKDQRDRRDRVATSTRELGARIRLQKVVRRRRAAAVPPSLEVNPLAAAGERIRVGMLLDQLGDILNASPE